MKRILALVLALMFALSAYGVIAEDDLTPITVLGYNQGNARMGYFEKSAAYEWLMTETRKLGIDLQIKYVEADQYKTTITTRLATGTDLANMMFLEVDNVTLNNLIKREMLTSIDSILEYSNGTARDFLAPDGEYSVIRKSGTGEDGTFWVLQGVLAGEFDIKGYNNTYSVAIRQDWLDKLGLEVPTTADEFIDTLIAFREQDANGDGIQNEKALFATDMSLLKHCGICGWYGLIMNNIGLDPNTDKVTSVFYQEGFKPYVEFVQKMVNAGVLSLADNGSLYTTDTQSIIAQNTVGAMYYQTKLLDTRDELTGDENCKYVPISIQGVDDIFPTCRGDYALTVYNGYYAFMNTVDKEAAAKLLDFCFTPEYWRWNRDGIEGRDWEYDENGNVTSLTPGMTADEMIAAGLGSGRFYMDRAVMPTLDISRTYATYNGEKIGTFESVEALKDSAYGKNVLAKAEKNDKKTDGRMVERNLLNWEQLEQKNATMFQTNVNTYLALPTDDEVKTLAEYESELKTAMNELFVNLIRGDKDIEKLDEYLDELRAMGLDEVIGVYQSRYDRFCGR